MPAFVPPDQRVSTTGSPVTMGPQGFWLDANGDIAATDPQGQPQVTPGMRDNPQAAIYYDAEKDLFYNVINGQKQYQSPANKNPKEKGTGFGKLTQGGQGQGVLHHGGEWNPETGEFDNHLDWGNIGSILTGAAIGGGALSAAGAFGSGGAGAAGGGGATAAGDAAPVLEGLAAGPGAISLPAGGAAAAASGSTIPELGALAGGAASGAVPAAVAAPLASEVAAPLAGGLAGGSSSGAVPAAFTTAPAVAPAAGKGVSSWLLSSALPVAGNLAGAAIQANAQNNATEAQQKYLAEALAYEKQRDSYLSGTEANRYANLTKNLAPYSDTGSAADARMAQVLGLPAPSKQAAQIPAPVYPTPPMPGSNPQAAAGGPTVMMRAPDGSTRPVPLDQQDLWRSKGAVPVGGRM